MRILNDIQAEALDMGITLYGVSGMASPPNYNAYLHWVQNGKSASMKYLSHPDALSKRKSPAKLLPNGKSMLVFGFRYPFSEYTEDGINGQNLIGKISSYALVPDYHVVIPEHLKILLIRIKRIIGQNVDHRIYTDTAPILEKEYGQLSGLGWIGKNSLLISPQIGSFFFLAEILLSKQLEETKPFEKDFCGQCTRCIEACPTGCIEANRTIDAGKCISYLTIENKSSIPRHYRKEVGTWIFGCDICQSVCPWNKKKKNEVNGSLFVINQNILSMDLHNLLSFTKEQFKIKFRGTPIMRAKRSGLLRNVLCALGNKKNPMSIRQIGAFLEKESDIMLREHAYWALGEFREKEARKILEKCYRTEPDTFLRNEIYTYLAEQKN